MLVKRNESVKGDCEVCEKMDVQLYTQHGNILMCEECRDKEIAAVERSKVVQKIVDDSRVIDASINLKTDVFLARTVAAVELRGAIDADETIAADQKEYTYAKECMTRFQNLQKVIFDKRQELLESENELRMWQVNVQTSAGKLRSELREQFKELDVNYQPTPITKKVKTTKPVKSGKPFDKTALYDAAKKYDVPAAQVQSIIVSRNMSADDAAKHLAGLLGKL